ncbi:MAG: fructose-1,6-bisphosphatase [Muribaculaceae bacterium]|nr:fructose-1,6-bisphosphatase [Bacteroidales bacterium]MDY4811673.1 fructose-1,6-bisphosphatase [Muribaculaceae bacterium]
MVNNPASSIQRNDFSSDRRVLELLSQTFPTVSAASTEIINLEAILNLPKGTEHFIADIHGEHEAFDHIVRNASGNIRRKVNEIYATSMREEDIRQLCTLVYYPERKLEELKESEEDMDDFYNVTLHRLVRVCRSVSSKYTRSKVRKALPREFAYIIEELLHEEHDDRDKQKYYSRIIETIISTGQADAFIIAISHVIQKLSIDWLHILGDVYDRGPGAHIIMDRLMTYERFDMQWGNHDALWLGAAAGNTCCIANVLRIALRYGNMATLEDGYGINLVPLATFAMDAYADDPCSVFMPKIAANEEVDEKTRSIWAKMHKAIAIIQFKLEGALIDKRPQWGMAERKLLNKVDYTKGTVEIEGVTYPLTDTLFPTIDPDDPYRLTDEEASLVKRLRHSFLVSDKLRRHVDLMLSHGCLYTIINSNLLFHASVPMNFDGTLKEVEIRDGRRYKGRELLHRIGMTMRAAFNDDTPADDKDFAIDYFWYLWCGPDSPLFDKTKMTTFERYFIADTSTHKEDKGAYYTLRDKPEVCNMILDAFGVEGEHRHIINGHVPVRVGKGECPVRADGLLLVIDGGFAKAYHNTTGIAGYTLVYHSRGLQLVQHEPFTSTEEAISTSADIKGTTQIVELSNHRQRVRDTDKGRELQGQIEELTRLLYAYRHGILTERVTR